MPNCNSPSNPMPTILPVMSSIGLTVDTMISMILLLFSSATPVAIMFPYRIRAMYRTNSRKYASTIDKALLSSATSLVDACSPAIPVVSC